MTKSTDKEPNKKVFQDRSKEADFWKKNISQAWSGGKLIKVQFAKKLSETINIRLDQKTLRIVRSRASKKGIGPTQLIRMWIKERIDSADVHLSS